MPSKLDYEFYKTKSGCIITNHKGRPMIWINGKLIGLSRALYEHKFGPIPDGMWVLHTCDNGACVNPKHLYLGNRQDNENDKIKRNRTCEGEKNGQVKLTEEQVKAILKDDRSYYRIAKVYGMSKRQIGRIKRGLCWKYLKGDG